MLAPRFLYVLGLGLLLSVWPTQADTCCDRAKAAGTDCDHLCCVKARKEKKVCETCNPKKENEPKKDAEEKKDPNKEKDAIRP